MRENETSLFIRPKESYFNAADLPVIQNLIGLGFEIDEVGLILGYQGADWVRSAAKTVPEYKQAIEMGLKLADANMISEIYKQVTGYNYDEVEDIYKAIEAFDDKGQPTVKLIKVGQKVRHKHQPGNGKLAEFLALNRLPKVFKKSMEITKKSFNLDATTELSADQIDRLAGRLLEVLNTRQLGQEGPQKAVESTVVPNPWVESGPTETSMEKE